MAKTPTKKRAKTLTDEQLQQLLSFIDETSTMPERDRLIVLLSFKAGLRAAEIAKLPITAMTDAKGNIPPQRLAKITVFGNVGKKGRERTIPMNPLIREALIGFLRRWPQAEYVAISSQPFRYHNTRSGIVASKPTIVYMTPNSLTVYYWRLLKNAGFEGASSHSGRRTFGTELARRANKFHNSLRDVQRLMGHARLDTTESYVEYSDDTFDMVASL